MATTPTGFAAVLDPPDNADLSWDTPIDGDGVQVRRNGVIEEEITDGSGTSRFENLAVGDHDFEIRAFDEPTIDDQYWTNFEGESVGSIPPGFTVRTGGTGASGWMVDSSADPEVTGSRVLRLNASTGDTERFISIDMADDLQDVEIVARCSTDWAGTDQYQNQVYARASEDPELNTYNFAVGNLVDGPRSVIERNVNQVWTELASGDGPTLVEDVFFRVRVQISGTTLRFRVWADNDPEPGTWTVTTTDSQLASGLFGVGALRGSRIFLWDWIGIGINGSSAPTSIVAGTVERSFSDWTAVQTVTVSEEEPSEPSGTAVFVGGQWVDALQAFIGGEWVLIGDGSTVDPGGPPDPGEDTDFDPDVTHFNFDSGITGWEGFDGDSFAHETSITYAGAGSIEGTRVYGTGESKLAFRSPQLGGEDFSIFGPHFQCWVFVPAGTAGTGWRARINLIHTDDSQFESGPYYDLVLGEWTRILADHTNTPFLDNVGRITVDVTADGADATVSPIMDHIQQGTYTGDNPPDPGTPTYTLSTSTVGSGSVTGGGTYDEDDLVAVEAIPDSGWEFDHWSGDLGGSINPTSILMDSDKSVTAHFVETQDPGGGATPQFMGLASDGHVDVGSSTYGAWQGGSNSSSSQNTERFSASSQGIPGYNGASNVIRSSVSNTTSNKYSRVHYEHVDAGHSRWTEGDEIWYAAAFWFPSSFFSNLGGNCAIHRWDAFPGEMQGGLEMRPDRTLRIMTGREPFDTVMGTSFQFQSGQWYHIECYQLLHGSDGTAQNEIWVDGVSIGANTAANFQSWAYSGDDLLITRLRTGQVGMPSGANGSLTLYFDRVTTSRVGRVGPP